MFKYKKYKNMFFYRNQIDKFNDISHLYYLKES